MDLSATDLVFQIGLPPHRIDILTSITAVDFAEAWQKRIYVNVAGTQVPVLSREHLVQNKSATGRPRDLADLAELDQQGQ